MNIQLKPLCKIINHSLSNSELPQLLINNYKWLAGMQNKNGSISDPYLKSTLDFQYHYGWYILNSLVLHKAENNGQYKDNADRAFNYFKNINKKINKNSNSFNAIPLILSTKFSDETKYIEELKKYLSKIELVPETGSPKANNFHCMKLLAILLKKEILNIEISKEEDTYIDQIICKKIIEWQYDDGFYYDKPYDQSDFKGIPHLTYHATITMLVIMSSIILEDYQLFKSGEKGIKALINIMSPNGETFGYGRSNHAIFGYSSAILALSLYNVFTDDIFNEYREILIKYINSKMKLNDRLLISPNHFEKDRSGYDEYMFVIVYNNWALGLLLLSHLIKPIDKELC